MTRWLDNDMWAIPVFVGMLMAVPTLGISLVLGIAYGIYVANRKESGP